MAEIITTTFQFKRGTAAKWAELNLILASGEPGFETDTGKLKLGNGRDAWLDLDYVNPDFLFVGETVTDFPDEGDANKLYRATKEQALYQWNPTERTYESLGNGGEGGVGIVDDELSITSENAISNHAVTEAFEQVDNTFSSLIGEDEGLTIRQIVKEVTSSEEFLNDLINALPVAEEASV